MNNSSPVTQAISVVGATPVTHQPNSAKIIPAIHLVLRSFLSLTFLSLTRIIRDSLLKCWLNPQKKPCGNRFPAGLVTAFNICLNPVATKNSGTDEKRQEYPKQCTQYYL